MYKRQDLIDVARVDRGVDRERRQERVGPGLELLGDVLGLSLIHI